MRWRRFNDFGVQPLRSRKQVLALFGTEGKKKKTGSRDPHCHPLPNDSGAFRALLTPVRATRYYACVVIILSRTTGFSGCFMGASSAKSFVFKRGPENTQAHYVPEHAETSTHHINTHLSSSSSSSLSKKYHSISKWWRYVEFYQRFCRTTSSLVSGRVWIRKWSTRCSFNNLFECFPLLQVLCISLFVVATVFAENATPKKRDAAVAALGASPSLGN